MSSTLILMRHGKAQRPSEDMLDMERRLTEAGKRSLVATLPFSLGLMPQKGASVQVWSSPAARAMETARIMQKACKRHGADMFPDIIVVDALWSQDSGAFLEAVRSCEADMVIAVGHNPFIEDVTADLTGSHIDFATGGFAAIRLSEDAEVGGGERPSRLLWFAQGPVSQRWKTVVQMESILGEAADAVQARLEAFLADSDDIETMHKFRVSIRTLRSLLSFAEPWQDSRQNKEAQANLKSVIAETSRLRELDVLTEQARDMESASFELVEYCDAKAGAERARVVKTLSSKRMAKLLSGVIDALNNVKWRKCVNAGGLEANDVRERFDELCASLESELESLDLADVEKTHDIRKEAKRVRYDAEKFKGIIGDDAVDIAKAMEAHQDNLGAICDARVNIDLINGFSPDDMDEKVAWDLALLRAQNETYLYTTLRNAQENTEG